MESDFLGVASCQDRMAADILRGWTRTPSPCLRKPHIGLGQIIVTHGISTRKGRGAGARSAPAPIGPVIHGKSSKHSSNPASDKRIVRDMSNILKKTSRHSLEIASHQAKLRNIRLFDQPPTRNFETFVKKVRRPSKLSRRSLKVDSKSGPAGLQT